MSRNEDLESGVPGLGEHTHMTGAGHPWPPGRGTGGTGRSWGWVQNGLGAPPPAPPPLSLRRCCCWAPPRWPASPWTSSSCSSTPSGCAAGGGRARSTSTRTAAARPGASSSPRWSAGERAGRGHAAAGVVCLEGRGGAGRGQAARGGAGRVPWGTPGPRPHAARPVPAPVSPWGSMATGRPVTASIGPPTHSVTPIVRWQGSRTA